MTDEQYDVVIVGGGAAGLSAATALGRARRTVVVIDAGEPRNALAEGVHNVLTRDGIAPAELVAIGRAEAAVYGVEFLDGSVDHAEPVGDGFAVTVGALVVTARRLLLASGLIDELPTVPGLRERWGRDALHCPYCHGWEVRDQRIGVLDAGAFSAHRALLFRQWSAEITLFLDGATALTAEESEQLAARGIAVVRGEADRVVVERDAIVGLEVSGVVHPLDAVVVTAKVHPRVPEGLGVEIAEHPMGMGTHVVTTPTGATSVPGVWAAGNVTDLAAQVVTAAAAGLWAGAQINLDLIGADTRAAVAASRADARRAAVAASRADAR
ncbi:NAD(P)/FAD-dependent oxidoreductase [Microbacteriaceae bacterium VKM Ac-2854]|nr:NAD(P)/FAD-dependent oxidoreductase [Microbacteriaceae bacterium VKM Ac-2854]